MISLLNIGFDFVMKTYRYSYITLHTLQGFILRPSTIIFLILNFLLFGLFFSIELSCISCYFRLVREQKNAKLIRMFFEGVVLTFRNLRNKKFMFPVISYFILIFTYIPVLIGIFLMMRIPNRLLHLLLDAKYFKYICIILILLLLVISYLNLFSVEFYLRKEYNFRNSLRCSRKLLHGRHMKTISYLITNNLFLFALSAVIYFITVLFVSLVLSALVDRNLVIAAFLSVYRNMNIVLCLFIGTLCMISNLTLIHVFYSEYKTDTPSLTTVAEIFDEPVIPQSPPMNRLILFTMVLLLLLNGSYLLHNIRNQSFYLGEALEGTQITSHRGNSSAAPENTLPAVQSAIDELADYAEIDIQETKDGVLVLMHDKTLYRTTRNTAHVYDLTYDEIESLDAGSWFRSEFAGTKVPTLREVLELCKGKIKLNIEVKITGHESTLTEQLLSLIDEFEFEQQCVITSTNTNILKQIKEQNSNLKTGYIISVAYGNFYDKDYIDFFSMKSTFVTERIVQQAHALGKEVHVWTVNSKSELTRVKELGVDSVITDYPILAREVLYEHNSNKNFISLIEKIVKRNY